MRFLRFALLGLLVLALSCGGSLGPRAMEESPLQVSAVPIPLNKEKPGQDKIGRLIYRGGLELSSPDKRFGGFSGLWVDPAGQGLLALSDHGWWWSSGLSYGARGFLRGLENPRLGRLKNMEGQPLALDQARSDSEELAPFGNGLAVSFERDHRILVYPAGSGLAGRPWSITFPSFMLGAPANQGAEAMACLPDGRLFLLLEAPGKDGWGICALGNGKAWSKLYYQRRPGFAPTAAAAAPDGRVFVLERFYTPLKGVKARVMLIPAGRIKPGARIKAQELAFLEPPLNLDNMEGLTVFSKNQALHLLLISDDNYSLAQRTLLMLFKLEQ